jgi:hypothetical protein
MLAERTIRPWLPAVLLAAAAARPAPAEVEFEIGRTWAAPGETASVPIACASREGLGAWSLVLRYDPSVLTHVEIEAAVRADRFEVLGPDRFLAAGRIHVEAAYVREPAPAPGEVVAWFRFCVAAGAAPGAHAIDSIRFAALNAGTLDRPVKDTFAGTSCRVVGDFPRFPSVLAGAVEVLEAPAHEGACTPDSHVEDLEAVEVVCPPAGPTDLCSLEVESASGAAGDVVPVTVLLRSRLEAVDSFTVEVDLCHDPRAAEIVGKPVLGDEVLELVGLLGLEFGSVDEDEPPPPDNPEYAHRGHGFHAMVSFRRGGHSERFPSDIPLPLLTVWYRLKGTAGDRSALSFCDRTLERPPLLCLESRVVVNGTERYLVETRDGSLMVLEGPPTRPERPPSPPEAEVYPTLPSAEEIGLEVEVSGAVARPGDREVPVEVHARAAVEYVALQIPVDFDERYLRLVRAEDHGITGTVMADNRNEVPGAGPDEGHAVAAIGAECAERRLAAAGESFHAATLWFEVLPSAAEAEDGSISLDIAPVTDARGLVFAPWIGVRHRAGTGSYETPVARVGPIRIASGRVTILPEVSLFVRGDANDDGRVDLTDSIATLGFIFIGGEGIGCPDAADVTDDGRIDVSDPVACLESLFLHRGPMPLPFPAPGPDPTPDELSCLAGGT